MRLLRTLVVITCAGLLVGCAASVPPAELIDARQAYQHATAGLAATLVPEELSRAQEALAAAERSFQDNPTSTRTRDLAYIAESKARRLAEALASSAASKAATIKAKSNYEADLSVIQTKKLIAEAKRRAAANKERNSLPQSTEDGSATKKGAQALKDPVRKSGEPPAVRSTPAIKGPRQRLGPRAKGSGEMRTARILLVDDNRDRRDSVRTILKSTDYQVVEAADSEKAIALIGDRMFDLILLGFTPPGESNIRVLASLKQYQLTTRVIVIRDAPALESAVKSATLAARRYFPVP